MIPDSPPPPQYFRAPSRSIPFHRILPDRRTALDIYLLILRIILRCYALYQERSNRRKGLMPGSRY